MVHGRCVSSDKVFNTGGGGVAGGGEAGPGGERTSAVASRQLRAPAVDTAASGHSVTRHSRAAASH